MSVARHRGPKRKPVTGLESWRDRWVEIRVAGGGAFRGKLKSVTEGMVMVERVGGRGVLVPLEHLTCVLDEDSVARSVVDDALGTAVRRRPGMTRRTAPLDVASLEELVAIEVAEEGE